MEIFTKKIFTYWGALTYSQLVLAMVFRAGKDWNRMIAALIVLVLLLIVGWIVRLVIR